MVLGRMERDRDFTEQKGTMDVHVRTLQFLVHFFAVL